ncbi:hypothetical protein [Erythrobacter sp.]|uniref:hypothetical protein n=1 Tax=Erythrobacter sp. TaxID=1042 RepID=UPI002EBB21B6|nr:hypothetical protein [Erythrobacter sp.]
MTRGGGIRFGAGGAAVLLCALAAATPVYAQSGEREGSTGANAVDAVTQPLTDLNLRNREIPPILLSAQAAPYALDNTQDCAALRGAIARLEDVLGPDADTPEQDRSLVNSALDAGGDVLGGMIPFRGLVRRISGARAAEARWEAAIYGGVARRSFLKGYLSAKSCPTAEEVSVRSARDVLGLEPIGGDSDGERASREDR